MPSLVKVGLSNCIVMGLLQIETDFQVDESVINNSKLPGHELHQKHRWGSLPVKM
jgi:hypothetical protein